MQTRAIVTHAPADGAPRWTLQDVTVRDIGADELLVRIVATGICHTDLVFSQWPADQIPYPKVLGHEGAGVVVKRGAAVEGAAEGDAVLLSFQSCRACADCRTGHPAFCRQFAGLNYGGDGDVYTTAAADAGAAGAAARGAFFGQSSFARLAVVKSTSVVNVAHLIRSEDELRLFAPLGCGFQTGVGTVDHIAGATADDTVVVFGLGGVGLVAVMAAKLKGCKTIIGVDRLPARLALATELGATHVLNTQGDGGDGGDGGDVDVTAQLLQMTGGVGATVAIDTTGHLPLIQAGLAAVAHRGQLIFVGVPPPTAMLDVHIITFMQTGKAIRGSIEGGVVPAEYIPKMIQWYREGKLPIDKLIQTYAVDDFATALADMKSGATIKPVLLW